MNTPRTSTNLTTATTKLLRTAALALALGFAASTAEARNPDVIGDQTTQSERSARKEGNAAKPLPVRPTKLTFARQTLPLVPAGTAVDFEETIIITGRRLAKVDYEETIVITGKRAPAKVDYEETIVITGTRLPTKVDHEETIVITGRRLEKHAGVTE